MNRSSINLATLLLLLIATRAWTINTASHNQDPPDAKAAQELFGGSMGDINRTIKIIRRTKFSPASRDANLKSLQKLEDAFRVSKLTYSSVEMSEAAKARFGTNQKAYDTAFRKDIIKGQMICLEIENAVLDEKRSDAEAAMRKMLELRTTAHDMFEPQ